MLGRRSDQVAKEVALSQKQVYNTTQVFKQKLRELVRKIDEGRILPHQLLSQSKQL